MRRKGGACVTATVAVFAAALALLPIGPARAASLWGADYFPNVPLTTQDRVTVRLYDDLLKGKAVAVNLIYTTCKDECPLETARLVQVQQLLGDRVGRDIFFYSISIDPKRDTPDALKAYAEKFGVGPGWLFLTGKKDDIKLVATKLGLSRRNDASSLDGHQPTLMIGDEPAGRWMRNSAVASPKFLAKTIGNFLGWENPQRARSQAEVAQLRAPKTGGEYTFQTRCSTCHTIGKGDGLGPDLAGVTTRRDRGWLVRYLKAPDEVLAEKDPIAVALSTQYKNVPMPNLRLSDAEIAALLGYLEAQTVAREDTKGKEAAAR